MGPCLSVTALRLNRDEKSNPRMEAAREKVAVYFEPDQSVITKITKDAKMTWSDKISWVGEENTIRILIFLRNELTICNLKKYLPCFSSEISISIDWRQHGSLHWLLCHQLH